MTFLTKLTAIGAAKLAAAQAGGTMVELSELALGDGDGAAVTPLGTETDLANEVWRGALSALSVSTIDNSIIIAEAIVPSAAGGFYVRELGVFDDDGDLFAYGSFPTTYKPVAAEGSTREMVVHTEIRVASAANVTITIDPSLILATRQWCDGRFLQKGANLSDVANAAAALANLGGAPLASPALTGNPTAPTPAFGDNDFSIATTAFVKTAVDAHVEVPIGAIMPLAGTPDSRWLRCNGAAYLQSAYPALFAKVGLLPRLNWGLQADDLPSGTPARLRFLNGQFVTLGTGVSSGGNYSTTDGYSWNDVTGNLDGAWNDMCWTGSKYVLVGADGSTKGLSNSTALGTAFTVRNHPWTGATLHCAASDGAGKVVVVGKVGTNVVVALSSNHGDTWASQALPSPPSGTVDLGLIYAAGRWILTISLAAFTPGTSSYVYTSTNGTAWTQVASRIPKLTTPSYFGGAFYVWGRDARGSLNVIKSTDGTTWTTLRTPAWPWGSGAAIDLNNTAVLPNGLFTFTNQTAFRNPNYYLTDNFQQIMNLAVPPAPLSAPATTLLAYGNSKIMLIDPGLIGGVWTTTLQDYNTATEFIVPDIGNLPGTNAAPFYIRAT